MKSRSQRPTGFFKALAWLPKMSENGVIIFHATNVHERNCGVWQFWQEITAEYIGVSFMHGHGVGVLYVGRQDNAVAQTLRWLDKNTAYLGAAQCYFERLGEIAIEHRTRSSELGEFRSARDTKIEELLSCIAHKDATIATLVAAAEQGEITINDPEARAVITKSLKRFAKVTKLKKALNFCLKSNRHRYKAQYNKALQLLGLLR